MKEDGKCREESNEDKWRFLGSLKYYNRWKNHGTPEEVTLTEEWDLVKYSVSTVLLQLKVSQKSRWGRTSVFEKGRFLLGFFIIILLPWCFPAKNSTLLFFLKYVFIWIIKCWGSFKSKKGNALISSVLKYYLSKTLSPNTQICVYLFLSCLASDESLLLCFYPLKIWNKLVVFISHSCLL